METTKISGAMVDSFQPQSPGMLTQCAMKGCKRSARIRLFYSVPGEFGQKRAGICKDCALGLANQAIGHFKFKLSEGAN